jgi:hypothetical protein
LLVAGRVAEGCLWMPSQEKVDIFRLAGKIIVEQ